MSRMRDIVENWGTFTKDTSSHKTEVTALVPLWPSRAQRGQVAEVHRIRRVVANRLVRSFLQRQVPNLGIQHLEVRLGGGDFEAPPDSRGHLYCAIRNSKRENHTTMGATPSGSLI